jgi:nucleotide-binding universal stress UspA family protein
VPLAARLAQHLGVPLHLVRALPPPETLELEHAMNGSDEYADFTAAAEQTLESEAHRQEVTGIAVSWEVIIGAAAPAVLETILPGDVIVMSSHGQGGVRRWLLGSVAEKLIHSGMAPVVLVPVADRAPLASGIA